jgi:hypothetical protein
MSKFKVGDRVRYTGGFGLVTGQVYVVERLRFNDGLELRGDTGWWYEWRFEPALPTLDNPQVGDVWLDDDGDERDVMAVVGKLVAISGYAAGREHLAFWNDIKYFKDHGFTVKGAEPELTELTLAEVAERVGVPVEKLRIKE